MIVWATLFPQVEADLVVISHDHSDHNNVSVVQGHPEIIKEPGVYEKNGIKLEIFSTFHDEVGGQKRGKNNVARLEAEGIYLIHAGDLGNKYLRMRSYLPGSR